MTVKRFSQRLAGALIFRKHVQALEWDRPNPASRTDIYGVEDSPRRAPTRACRASSTSHVRRAVRLAPSVEREGTPNVIKTRYGFCRRNYNAPAAWVDGSPFGAPLELAPLQHALPDRGRRAPHDHGQAAS